MSKVIIKKQIIQLTAISLILGILIFFSYHQYNKVINISKNITKEVEKLNQYKLIPQNLQNNLFLIKKTDEEIKEFDKYIFKSGLELEIITDLENIANQNKVIQKILDSNLDKYSQNKIDLTINLTGEYEDLLKYLIDLENYKNIIIINKIEFHPNEQNKENEKTNAILRINISLYVDS